VQAEIDLVMWTKNGANTLPSVLERISEVVPDEFVNKKVVTDDSSIDDTRSIAENYGWKVVSNAGRGISDNANTALSNVSSKFFVSFEQDLLLARDWWNRIPSLLRDPKVAAASGMRFASRPPGVRKLQQYVAKKYRGEAYLASWLRARQMAAFTLGKTLDNTIWKTRAIRSVGGFPKIEVNAGVDTTLAYRLQAAGYHWIVDYSVQSIHLRKDLRQELQHQYWYATQLNEIWGRIKTETNHPPPITRMSVMSRFLTSPFTGVFVAIKTREPSIVYIHPLIRFYYLKGFLESGKFRLKSV